MKSKNTGLRDQRQSWQKEKRDREQRDWVQNEKGEEGTTKKGGEHREGAEEEVVRQRLKTL